MTTDRNDPLLKEHHESGYLKGQQKAYLVLSEEERAKGFLLPVRCSYRHIACGSVTTMGQAIAETYSRDPFFYGGTFCCACGKHFNLRNEDGSDAFLWEPDGAPVGRIPDGYHIVDDAGGRRLEPLPVTDPETVDERRERLAKAASHEEPPFVGFEDKDRWLIRDALRALRPPIDASNT